MPTKRVNQIPSSIKPNNHPYLNGAWTPNYNEYNATDMQVIGTIPDDLDGVYIRNTENPIHEPIGRYHPFDGDGMIHSIGFRGGKTEYRNRFVRTKGFAAEQEAGKSLWAGLMEHPKRSTRPGWGAQENLKDSSSTDVIVHAGELLSTFYQCGDVYRLDPYTLEQYGTQSWVPLEGVSAHATLDENTGELLFFNYSKHAPYMHYGVVGPDNRLKHYTPIPLPGPRLPHDMCFTKNYSILNDLPLFWDPELLKQDIHAGRFYPELPSRFAVIPRYGSAEDIQWFEADPTYILHFLNAYEEGDEIIMDAYFQEDPVPANYHYPDLPRPEPGYDRMMAFLDQELLKPRLHRWRFNLKTGKTTEQRLDERNLEFGTINQRYAGQKYRYGYSAIPERGFFLFSGLTKHDLETSATRSMLFGDNRFGSEAVFAPRTNIQHEDDGYLLTFISDLNTDKSECLILDAKDITAEPVCRIILPHRICSGTHATWAHGEDIRAAQERRKF
jgi:carotenoid cleavage dioxygenase-like enzyme